jgi:hypothetical protein
MDQPKPSRRLLRVFTEYGIDGDLTPWWADVGEADPEAALDMGPMDVDDLRALGLSDALIRDGQAWNQEWDKAATAALDRDDDDESWSEGFTVRGTDLARQTVLEVPTLWVQDSHHDWHVGAEQLTYPGVLTTSFEPGLLLDVPVDDGDAWPWWFEPAGSTPDGAWRVPLPRDFRWGEELPAATAQSATAWGAAPAAHDVEHALRLARPALAAMSALTWRIQGLGVRDFTNRDGDIEDSNFRSRRLHGHLTKELKQLIANTPAPPDTERGQWFAYAPLTGETFKGH